MTITNSYLNNVAKAMAGESYSYPTDMLVGTGAVTSIDVTATALEGEIGTRESATVSRALNVVTYNAVRSGTAVLDTTNGDDLTSVGFDVAATGEDLQLAVVISELHTTAFDLEIDADITHTRG